MSDSQSPQKLKSWEHMVYVVCVVYDVWWDGRMDGWMCLERWIEGWVYLGKWGVSVHG
jgi:hypothetical protein